jgi:hypothetical protein
MANRFQSDYFIVSRAAYDLQKKAWFVHVNISWRSEGELHIHKLSPPKYFDTSAQATDEGFRLADFWINQKS